MSNNKEENPLVGGSRSHDDEDSDDNKNSDHKNSIKPVLLVRHDNHHDVSTILVHAVSRCTGGDSSSSSSSSNNWVGLILITLGSFCFSGMFLFVKLMEGTANSFTMTFYRALVEIPMALILCFASQEHPLGPHDKNIRAWLWVRGGMGGAAVLCFFYAIQSQLPLPDAVTLQFTTPPFAAAFAVCLVGEPWLWMDRLGAAISLVGVMLIAHPSWLFDPQQPQQQPSDTNTNIMDADDNATDNDQPQDMGAIIVALLGAAFAGLAYTSVRKIGHGASANVMVLYYSCLSLPITMVGSKGLLGTWNVWSTTTSSSTDGAAASFTWMDWCWMLLTGISAYAGQYLTNLGLQHETAAKGTLATCTQIVFTYVFELAFLHEPINGWSVAGTLLIMGVMAMVTLHKLQGAAAAADVNDETMLQHESVACEELEKEEEVELV